MATSLKGMWHVDAQSSPILPYLDEKRAAACTGASRPANAYVAATLRALVSEPERSIARVTSRWTCFGCSRDLDSVAVNGRSDRLEATFPCRGAPGADHAADGARTSCSPPSKGFSGRRNPRRQFWRRVEDVRAPTREAGREARSRHLHGHHDHRGIQPLIAMDLRRGSRASATHVTWRGAHAPNEGGEGSPGSKRPGLILADIQLADGSVRPGCGQRPARDVPGCR